MVVSVRERRCSMSELSVSRGVAPDSCACTCCCCACTCCCCCCCCTATAATAAAALLALAVAWLIWYMLPPGNWVSKRAAAPAAPPPSSTIFCLSLGCPSRRAWLVFSMAFLSPMSNQVPFLVSRSRNLPFCSRMAATMLRDILSFSAFRQVMYKPLLRCTKRR